MASLEQRIYLYTLECGHYTTRMRWVRTMVTLFTSFFYCLLDFICCATSPSLGRHTHSFPRRSETSTRSTRFFEHVVVGTIRLEENTFIFRTNKKRFIDEREGECMCGFETCYTYFRPASQYDRSVKRKKNQQLLDVFIRTLSIYTRNFSNGLIRFFKSTLRCKTSFAFLKVYGALSMSASKSSQDNLRCDRNTYKKHA